MNEKTLLVRLLTAAAMLALSLWLVKTAVCLLMEVWWVLLVVGVAITIGILAWRYWRSRQW